MVNWSDAVFKHHARPDRGRLVRFVVGRSGAKASFVSAKTS
jgi:hypothetical protein